MSKLHELLAAEKTPNAAWNELFESTMKKFKSPGHFYEGHSKTLAMIEDSPANKAVEAQAREEKPVTTTVNDTLDYALDIYCRAEDLQLQKNEANARARGTVMLNGEEFLPNLTVDELLGLESRLGKLRLLVAELPTLDATKHWTQPEGGQPNVWETRFPEETTKTEKRVTPVIMSPATDKHPAQVQAVAVDAVVGRFTTVRRSGAATALQKATALKVLDTLLVEVKQARMRANETEVGKDRIGSKIKNLLMDAISVQE
jgi:hypothetical protein